jgi:Uma2 family endonuclease
MATAVVSPVEPAQLPPLPVRCFTVDEYHRMIDAGVFVRDAHCELLEGWIVVTTVCSPPHATVISLVSIKFRTLLPEEWHLRVRCSITTKDSEPRPDLAVVRGPIRRYLQVHPGLRETGLIVEISDQSTAANRHFKQRVFARARIPEYWIVNLVASTVQVFTQPKSGKAPSFQRQRDYGKDEAVSLVLAEREIAQIPVKELLL